MYGSYAIQRKIIAKFATVIMNFVTVIITRNYDIDINLDVHLDNFYHNHIDIVDNPVDFC